MSVNLNSEEEKFCLLYVNAPAPYAGNATKCYTAVYGWDRKTDPEGVQSALSAHRFMQRQEIKDRISQLEELNVVDATTLRPRLTQTLLKIADECSTSSYTDRWGIPQSPAALRSVAVNAIKTLSDIYGIKEDVAHKVSLEGADGSGVVINVIAPQKTEQPNFDDIVDNG